MKYHVEIKSSAQKQFIKLPNFVKNGLANKLLHLEDDPRPHGCQKLRDSSYYRLRFNDYRIIYEIDDQKRLIFILNIDHRKDIYRK